MVPSRQCNSDGTVLRTHYYAPVWYSTASAYAHTHRRSGRWQALYAETVTVCRETRTCTRADWLTHHVSFLEQRFWLTCATRKRPLLPSLLPQAARVGAWVEWDWMGRAGMGQAQLAPSLWLRRLGRGGPQSYLGASAVTGSSAQLQST